MTAMNVLTPLQGTPLEGTSTDWFDPNGCYSKQTWTYSSDGTLEIKDDQSCVIPGSQESASGTWQLSNNNSKIDIMVGWYGNFSYSIIDLTQSKLTVQRVVPTGVGGTQVIDLLMQYEFAPQ